MAFNPFSPGFTMKNSLKWFTFAGCALHVTVYHFQTGRKIAKFGIDMWWHTHWLLVEDLSFLCKNIIIKVREYSETILRHVQGISVTDRFAKSGSQKNIKIMLPKLTYKAKILKWGVNGETVEQVIFMGIWNKRL